MGAGSRLARVLHVIVGASEHPASSVRIVDICRETGNGLRLKPGSFAPYDYLPKPFRGVELLDAIERCLIDKRDEAEVIHFENAPRR